MPYLDATKNAYFWKQICFAEFYAKKNCAIL